MIIAGERGRRPNPFRHYSVDDEGADRAAQSECPFCPGREAMTPAEVLAYPPANGGEPASRWGVRVVPNRFPALRIEGALDKQAEGLYDRMRGVGAHEVVIETPEHASDPARYSDSQMLGVIQAYRDRMTDLLRDSRFRYVLAFKNHGAAAGATLEHPHSQIIALPIVPARLEAELEGA
ncbi:MAG: galactose-1-phosphate uridylyltransferase, partial [Anaerolineales bacterium]